MALEFAIDLSLISPGFYDSKIVSHFEQLILQSQSLIIMASLILLVCWIMWIYYLRNRDY